MKITHLTISSFLGAREIDAELTAPVCLIAGANGSGKSSIRDAIALAMTGDMSRIHLKKDAASLITEGAGGTSVDVFTTAGDFHAAINKAGKISESAADSSIAAIPYVLDAQRFACLDPTGRREFLFGLLGIETSHKAIAERLMRRGCDAKKVEPVMPILRAGFDAGHKHAKEMTSQARGAWKAVTGETYGSQKADGWAAPAGAAVSDADVAALAERLRAIGTNIDAGNQRIGALNAEAAQARQRAAKVADLQEKAGRIARIEDKLARDQAELVQWSTRLDELPPAPGAVDTRPALACPDCGIALVLNGGRLEHYTAPKTDDADTATKRKQWQDAVTLYTRSVENDKRDLADAQRAQAELTAIEGAAPAPDEEEFAAARRDLELLQADNRTVRAEYDALFQRQREAEGAAEKTAQATKAHTDAQQWSAIADALSPDGIQSEMLAEALEPLNKRISEDAGWAEWPVPRIGADMAITINGRPYNLLSESEQWRTDALIAAAVAHFSGLRMLVLDRFDVLDAKGREDLLLWMSDIAAEGEIDTALLFGTLKAAPAGLPEGCMSIWLEKGKAAAGAAMKVAA